jgi:aldehyde:ferredoxin oxidoreductase
MTLKKFGKVRQGSKYNQERKEHQMAEKKAPSAPPAPAGTPAAPVMPGGYNGKILRVNLTNMTTSSEPISDRFCRMYIGGAGFIAYYLWKELKAGIDALSPENKLIFALGPITGLAFPGASRNCVGAKSPLTGGIAKSEVGGFWMAELKRAGFDAIIVEGKAKKPVYLWVHDGEASIRDGTQLWGKETRETEASIRGELGDERIQVAMIGPAGEKMVRYACVMEGLHDAAGRGGLGAVMGSKNLKAIAVRGHKLPKINDSERLKAIRQNLVNNPHPMHLQLGETGTGGMEMVMMESRGVLPVHNFRDGVFPEVKNIHSVALKEAGLKIGMEGCYACPIRCKKVVKFEEPYHVDAAYGGPEFESLGAFGGNCGISDARAICKANERCNAYSLDAISTGDSIAFVMECFEKGFLTTKDTGGIDLRFGNADALLQTIELISRREGFGDFLAEGTARMAKKIGQGSEEFAMNVKGLEYPMPESRGGLSMGLGYMVNPHGADHVSSDSPSGMAGIEQFGVCLPVPEGVNPKRLSLFKLNHCLIMVQDLMVFCAFPVLSYETKLDLIKAVTGWNTTWVELIKVSERVLTLMRLFNIREGFSAADDVLAGRSFQPKLDRPLPMPVPERENMDKAKRYYYAFMGWDANGVPLPEKIEDLCIE